MEDVKLRALFAPAPGDEYEFLSLSEAEEAAGVQIGEDLKAMLDGECLSCFLVPDGVPSPPELSHLPLEHRTAAIVASFPMYKTLDRRDPVLVIDAEELFLMFVVPPERLERYLSSRYRQQVPLVEPPENKYERWVVSIARSGSLMRTIVGVGPMAGIGRT